MIKDQQVALVFFWVLACLTCALARALKQKTNLWQSQRLNYIGHVRFLI
jgi:hypothetical protein